MSKTETGRGHMGRGVQRLEELRHPTQPIGTDELGTLRFKSNAIVTYLLYNGGIDLNAIACKGFADEDRCQFAQLIGYSLDGYCGELPYVSQDARSVAERKFEEDAVKSDDAIRADALQSQLDSIRESLREAAVRAFKIHPDDLR